VNPQIEKAPRGCPGCGRDRATCWVLPCLYLERVRLRGTDAVASFIRAGLPGHLRAGVRVQRRVG
jgi:hypothetical protein